MTVLIRFLISVLLAAATLVFEVLLAVTLYMYLELSHPTLFGQLVGWAGGVFDLIEDAFVAAAPDGLVVKANTSFLGEISNKAFLLLFIGLFASGVLRTIGWGIAAWRRAARRAE